MSRDAGKTVAVAALLHGVFTVSLPWLILRQTREIAWLNVPLGHVRWIGLAAIASGVYLYCAALIHLLTLKTSALPGQEPTRMADTGWYARVRHPLLLGIVLILFGEAIAFASIALGGYAVLYWLVMDAVARKEERDLERVFGAAYVRYAAAVPRWIPRLGTKLGTR